MNYYGNDFEEDSKYYEEYFDECESDNSMNLAYHIKAECQTSYKKIINQQTKDISNENQNNNNNNNNNVKQISTTNNEMKVNDKSYCQITEAKQPSKESVNKSLYIRNKQVLRRKEVEFKEDFYSIFLHDIKGKKIIPKDKVIAIHNSICDEAGVRRMTRNEYRVINNYFKHFAKYRFQIIQSIIRNKEELSKLIDLPSIIQRATEVSESRNKKYSKQTSTNNDK